MLKGIMLRFLIVIILSSMMFATAVPPALSSDTIISIVFPVAGEYSFEDTFGAPRGGGTRTHEGIDVIAKKMTPVLAAVDGTVGWLNDGTETSTAYNLMLRGDDGNDYFYIHLNNDIPGTDDGMGGPENAYAPGIVNGVRVAAGQHIAYIGDSGNAEDTVSHLHFEIHHGGYKNPINPYLSLVAAKENRLFKDTDTGQWYYQYIDNLVKDGVVSGYSDGTFRPGNPVTRAEFTKMVVAAVGIETTTVHGGYFPDVPVEHWAWPYIEAAKNAGIIDGDANGNFRPDTAINRAEAAKIVTRARGMVEDMAGDPFLDVTQDFWAYPSIMTARNRGIICGYTDGTYRPLNLTNRAETSKIIYLIVS